MGKSVYTSLPDRLARAVYAAMERGYDRRLLEWRAGRHAALTLRTMDTLALRDVPGGSLIRLYGIPVIEDTRLAPTLLELRTADGAYQHVLDTAEAQERA